jgi:hypothetical protein
MHKVLDRGAQAVVRGGARCALQVLDRSAQADTRGATHLLDRGVQAVARGAARCALHLHCRDANEAMSRIAPSRSQMVLVVKFRLDHARFFGLGTNFFSNIQ